MEEGKEDVKDHINQTQFYDLITSDELSWQDIIYDLIKTEQLDPWNINLGVLADRYVEVISGMEEENFFVSSKVLLACSLLLRLKTDILSNKFIQELDEALYGKQDVKKYELERIELGDDEIPILVPRTPMPRFKKVTLKELIGALNQAIETENRRIKRDIKGRQAEKSALTVMPDRNRVPLKSRISIIFQKIKGHFTRKEIKHMKFSELAGTREEKLAAFLPILHLNNNDKIYLRQDKHYEEIFMHLDKIDEDIEGLQKEIAELKEGISSIE